MTGMRPPYALGGGSSSSGSGSGATTLISSQVLASPAATVTFSSIPGTYNSLKIVAYGRCSDAATSATLTGTFNGDGLGNYDDMVLQNSSATAAGAFATSAGTSMSWGSWPASTASAGNAGQLVVDIAGYAGTTFNKTVLAVRGWIPTNGTTSGYKIQQGFHQWRSTAAIVSIAIGDGTGGNFVTGSAFYLYGIK